ncbi:hypothetical protein [Rufibacter latericius]|uniref:Entericidin n=1 Tax=Rufibacter latericius TaxID=2487040 RepID=A0A3M9MUU0_9BACT|nr:hypothetical protein [Rufibacter latericius]RNI28947.1 hypothetical protein EFB08_05800 [Rufibacter latericius]
MKKIIMTNLMALSLVGGIFSSCGGDKPAAEKTGNTTTEDMVEGADGGLDSLNLEDTTTTTTTGETNH